MAQIGGLCLAGMCEAVGGGTGETSSVGGEESETVLAGADVGERDPETCVGPLVLRETLFEGKPEMTGGGRSRPSAAFLES